MNMRILLALAALGTAVACVPKAEPPPAPEPVPTPAPTPPPLPAPAPAADWRDIPLTPGGWSYQQAGSAAAFGPAGAPAFTVRCDRAQRQVVLARTGAAAGNTMTVRTSFGSRSLPLQVDGGSPQLVARLPASDKLLDDIAFSRGRFTVQVPGTPMLVIPAWPEPARVVEDCRA